MIVGSEDLYQEKAPIVGVLDDLYASAYALQLDGQNPIDLQQGLTGPVEVIGLNSQTETTGDNVRFLVSGGGLDFNGLCITIDGEVQDVKYFLMKITLPPGDKTPIQGLGLEELQLVTALYMDAQGRVSNGITWFEKDETDILQASLEASTVAPTLPDWGGNQQN